MPIVAAEREKALDRLAVVHTTHDMGGRAPGDLLASPRSERPHGEPRIQSLVTDHIRLASLGTES